MKSKKIIVLFSLLLTLAGLSFAVYKQTHQNRHIAHKFIKHMKIMADGATNMLLVKTYADQETMAQQFSGFVRLFYFMIAGYPGVTESADALTVTDTSPYYALNNRDESPCNPTVGAANCDASPPAGMLSLYNQIILGYQDATWSGVAGILAAQGYTTCESIPETQTSITIPASYFPDGVSATVTADVPLKTIPTGHAGAGGQYDRRLEITYVEDGFTNKFLVELKCQTAAQIAAGQIQLYLAFAIDEGGSGTRYMEFFVDKNDVAAQKFEIFMDMDSSVNANQLMALKMNINGTANVFNYDMIMASQDSETVMTGMRMNVLGDVTGDDFTLGFQSSGQQATFGAIGSGTGADSTAVTHTFTSCEACQGPPSDEYVIVCLEGDGTGTYTGPSDGAILTGSSCPDLTLSQNSTAPAIDADGTWSLDWVAGDPGLNSVIWDGNF